MSMFPKKKLLAVLLIVLIAIFIIFFSNNNSLIGNSDSNLGLNSLFFLKKLIYSWNDFFNGGGSMIGPFVIAYFFLYLFNLVGLSYISTPVLIIMLFLLSLVTYGILNLIFPQKDKKSIVIKLLLSSFAINNEIVRGFLIYNTTALWGLFLMFCSIYFYLIFYLKDKKQYKFFSLITICFSCVDVHSCLLGLGFILFFSLVDLLVSTINHQKSYKSLYKVGSYLLIFILINFYWIANNLFELFGQNGIFMQYASDASLTDNILDTINSYNNLFFNITLFSKNSFLRPQIFIYIIEAIFSLLFFISAFCSIKFVNRKMSNQRVLIIFYILFIVITSLSFGQKNMLGIFDFLWKHLPGFTLFRDFFKFQRVLLLIYIILATHTFIYLSKYIKSIKKIIYFSVIILVIRSLPLLINFKYYKPFIIPSYYLELRNYLSQLKTDSRLTIMPLFDWMQVYDWSNQNYDTHDPIRYFSSIPLVLVNANFSYSLTEKIAKEAVSTLAKGDYDKLFNIMAFLKVKYFIIRDDLQPEFIKKISLSDRKMIDSVNIDKLNQLAKESPLIKKEKEFGKLNFYSIADEKYTSSFYIPHEIKTKIYVKENFIDDIENKTDAWDAIYYYDFNNNGSIEKLLTLDKDQEKRKVSFDKKNQTLYILHLDNVPSSFPLIFKENYHRGWKIFSKKSVSSNFDILTKNIIEKSLFEGDHMIVDGTFNSWIIDSSDFCANNFCQINDDGSYTYDLVIEFTPQRITYFGISVSLLFLIIYSFKIIIFYIGIKHEN